MSRHFLGDTLDIHCGAVDLFFPHHEDEIAQSEAASGRPLARHWLHGEFLMIRGSKMSKRYGNFLTARDLREQGVEPAAIRYLFGQTHYRKQLDWSDEALDGAKAAVARLGEFRERLGRAASGDGAGWGEAAATLERRCAEALDDDLNVAVSLGAVMDFVREGNALLDRGAPVPQEAAAGFERVTNVLQVVPLEREAGGADETWARSVAEERARSKQERNWARADELRKLLYDKGFEVRDTRDGGFEIRRVTSPTAAT